MEETNDRLFVDPAKMGLQWSRRIYLDDPGFSFWLPAFKVNPSIFLKLAERATVAQPALNHAVPDVRENLYPVTLPAGEAARLVKVIATLLVGKPEAAHPWFDRVTAQPDEAQLCFIPFSFSGYELVQEEMKMSVFPNALKYGKNL